MANPNPQSGFQKNPQNINRKGRPKKGYSITEMMKEMLEALPEIKLAIGQSIVKSALKGDNAAQKLLWNYMDGMPTQAVELTGEEGGPVEHEMTIKFVRADAAE